MVDRQISDPRLEEVVFWEVFTREIVPQVNSSRKEALGIERTSYQRNEVNSIPRAKQVML